jgi:hypothetical protein
MWFFDDPAVGLHREPFVAGIDKVIDQLVASIPNAERGFRLIFSATPFPGHTVKLEWRREESGAASAWWSWDTSSRWGLIVTMIRSTQTNRGSSSRGHRLAGPMD